MRLKTAKKDRNKQTHTDIYIYIYTTVVYRDAKKEKVITDKRQQTVVNSKKEFNKKEGGKRRSPCLLF